MMFDRYDEDVVDDDDVDDMIIDSVKKKMWNSYNNYHQKHTHRPGMN